MMKHRQSGSSCNTYPLRTFITIQIAILFSLLLNTIACGSSGTTEPSLITATTVTVNSLDDTATPPNGQMTLRAAIPLAGSAKTIQFAPALNGRTIELTTIGENHSALKAELYTGMTFNGYGNRDYGKSALYAHGDLTIDASNLPAGIVIHWNGGDTNPARVLGVYGNLTMDNVSITGGYAKAEALTDPAQPYTLARGGGLAVWGRATLTHCKIYGNRIEGDNVASRDRGALGGGIYANSLDLKDTVVSGNSAKGYGAAGGGIYSVGGADNTNGIGNYASLNRCVVTGNRTTGQSSYGGGIFTLAGGPNNLGWMYITNTTIARNLVEDNPDLPEAGQYYYRGGGLYLGGGSVQVTSSTIAENAVTGPLATFSNSPNIGGGGVAGTIGNAHVVEEIILQDTIVVGNNVNGTSGDVYSGSLLNFYSYGYNRIGTIDLSRILAPVADWMDLSRKHYPKLGDLEGVSLAEALQLDTIQSDGNIRSVGTDNGQPAVIWYRPGTISAAQVPAGNRSIPFVKAGYTGFGKAEDDFLNHVVEQVRTEYSSQLGTDFGSDFGDMTGVTWYEAVRTWPSDPRNAPWIAFWRDLDTKIGSRLGSATLADDFWGSFTTGPLDSTITITVQRSSTNAIRTNVDQRGNSRGSQSYAVGAIENN